MTHSTERLTAALDGRYRIERELGAGGMATVYLAEDLKHDRKVAIKVLKPELAAVLGAERFVQEIKTTAALSHPHILPLFDSGEAGGFLYYVMPYIQGETIREKLNRETQFGIDEALRITTAIADALDYAHRQGVIHRDIKPENILLHDGRPMVMDFGIALALSAAAGGRMTETGLSLGTPHYMSPEQATADKAITGRSDIYSLASVCYEMLAGEPPHMGNSAQQIIMKIIAEPAKPASELRKAIPPHVTAALARALEKLPADRFESAREFAEAIGNPAFRTVSFDAAAAVGEGTSGQWTALAKGLAVVAGVLALAFAWSLLRPAPQQPVERFNLALRNPGVVRLSPDGSAIVFAGPDQGNTRRLWLRRWGSLTPTPIPGTEGDPEWPVFSPEGDEVAFKHGGVLKVAPLLAGVVRTLADSVDCCVRWGSDGYVYFSPSSDRTVARVRAAGGAVERVTRHDGEDDGPHGDFEILPGGDVGVFSVFGSGTYHVDAIRLSTGERKTLTTGINPHVTPTGHLVVGSSDGQLQAARFDAKKLALTGPAVPVAQGVLVVGGFPVYSLSRSGTLVHMDGGDGSGRDIFEFVWMSRAGNATPVDTGETFRVPQGNIGWRLSPDGTRIAFATNVDGSTDIFIKHLPDGRVSRLTFSEDAFLPRWAPDGRSITYPRSPGGGVGKLWSMRTDGTGDPELVFDGFNPAEGFWSPNREWLVIRRAASGVNSGARDIFAIRPGVDSAAVPLVASPRFLEQAPALSRDGRWLAYSSNETGRHEIFVRPFPDVGSGRWQVSSGGGLTPAWAHNGRELFFVDPETRTLKAAAFTTTATTFQPSRPSTLFEIPNGFLFSGFGNGEMFDVAPGDQRFLMARRYGSNSSAASTILVQGFLEEVKRLVPK